eukprot:c22705_g1_i2 orf=479-1057(-)
MKRAPPGDGLWLLASGHEASSSHLQACALCFLWVWGTLPCGRRTPITSDYRKSFPSVGVQMDSGVYLQDRVDALEGAHDQLENSMQFTCVKFWRVMARVNKERLGQLLHEVQCKENIEDRYAAALRGETLTGTPDNRIRGGGTSLQPIPGRTNSVQPIPSEENPMKPIPVAGNSVQLVAPVAVPTEKAGGVS